MPESILCALVNLTLSEGDKPLEDCACRQFTVLQVDWIKSGKVQKSIFDYFAILPT